MKVQISLFALLQPEMKISTNGSDEMPRKIREPQAQPLAVIYARYSSHAQNDASIEQQVAECEAYATSHGYKVIGT